MGLLVTENATVFGFNETGYTPIIVLLVVLEGATIIDDALRLALHAAAPATARERAPRPAAPTQSGRAWPARR